LTGILQKLGVSLGYIRLFDEPKKVILRIVQVDRVLVFDVNDAFDIDSDKVNFEAVNFNLQCFVASHF
jgi:Pyruvate/2-oxoacid:ferredoxin oxidoreductase gamma subunit